MAVSTTWWRISGIVEARYMQFVRTKLASKGDAQVDREFDLHVRISRLELRQQIGKPRMGDGLDRAET